MANGGACAPKTWLSWACKCPWYVRRAHKFGCVPGRELWYFKENASGLCNAWLRRALQCTSVLAQAARLRAHVRAARFASFIRVFRRSSCGLEPRSPPRESLANWLRSSVGRYRHVGHAGGVCGLGRSSAAPSQVGGRSWERHFDYFILNGVTQNMPRFC